MSRYIDIGFILNETDEFGYENGVLYGLSGNSAPTIDIVLCKECKYRYMDADLQVWTCTYGLMIKPDGFCNYGERRESE